MTTETIREAIENGNPIYLWKNKTPQGTIELKKDKQFIKCIKDSSKTVEYWYDLSEGKFLAHYSTKKEDRYINIKSIIQWFTNCNIITFNYTLGKMILFNKNHITFRKYTHPARFIQKLNHSYCTKFEQWEKIGIKIEEVEKLLNEPNIGRAVTRYSGKISSHIRKSPSQVNKQTINQLKKYTKPIPINSLNIFTQEAYNQNKHKILQKLMIYEENPEYQDLFLINKGYGSTTFSSVLTDEYHKYEREKLLNTINGYNIDIDKFIKYLRQLKDFEHTDIEWIIYNYDDYLDAEKQLRNGKMRKMNKYPNNLVQMHHNKTSTIKEIEIEKRRLQDIEQKEKDKEIYKSYQDLAWNPRNSEYCIIVPESADDIIEEGNQLNHCVGSYISKISNKQTFIVFMREKEALDISQITVEIQNGKLTTALGYMNRRLNKEEKIFLEKYAEKKDLMYIAYDKVGDGK